MSFVPARLARRSWLLCVLSGIWLVGGIACGGRAPDAPPSQPGSAGAPDANRPDSDKKPRVALLSPGPISDDGWNAFGYDALKIIEKELGCEVRQQQVNDSPADREQGFRAFAQEGFDVVIGHGGEFADQALAVARDFPNTTFVVTAGDKAAPNVVSVVFDTGQASYLAGAIAATLSKTGRAGAIGGQNIPASARNLYAFRNGARAVNPNMEVAVAFIGSWTDTAAARQQALAMIDKGADFIIHDCDAAAAGVFQAVKERDIRAFGMQKDQSHLAPDHIIGSPTSNPQGLAEVVRRILQKEQKGEVVHLGLKDNAVGFAVKKGVISKELEGKLNALTLAIQKGEIDVFKEQP